MNTTNPDLDLREQLFNQQLTGTAHEIALPRENVTVLHGIMIDFDPEILIPGNPLFSPGPTPEAFLAAIQPALDRHPLARNAEIRGARGLHANLWFDSPVELQTAADQAFWTGVVKAVQLSLPSDDRVSDINALTRPLDSTNAKNGERVRQLRKGAPISPNVVKAYVEQLREKPFRCLAEVLCGPSEHVRPCPICRSADSSMGIFDHIGKCYTCGQVTWEMLITTVVVERKPDARPPLRQRTARAARGTGTVGEEKGKPRPTVSKSPGKRAASGSGK